MVKSACMAALCSIAALVGSGEERQESPAPNATSTQSRTFVVTSDDASADPIVDLRTAYVLLRQVDPKQLDEQPKALTERALVLYRDGLKAYEQGKTDQAKRLGAASRELAHALELTRVARAADDDSDLPPPPPLRLTIRAAVEPGNEKGEPAIVEIPPVINGTVEIVGPEVTSTTTSADGKANASVVITNVDGKQKLNFLTRDGRHTYLVEVPQQEIRERVFARRAAPARVVNIPGHADIPRAVTHTLVIAQDQVAQARTELQAAYDLIKKARAERKGDESKIYLDAARDLYNTARREAQNGRYARASELAQAAIAIARVPSLLAGEDEKPAQVAEKIRARVVRREGTRTVESTDNKPKQVEVRVESDATTSTSTTSSTSSDGKPKVRVEIRKRVVDENGKVSETVEVKEGDEARALIGSSDGPATVTVVEGHAIAEAAEAHDDAGPVVGIGVALEQDDDVLVVRELVPDGPAAKEGTIQPGDVLFGIEKEGVVEEFKGKPLVDVVKQIRGDENSTVHIVIVPQGDGEKKTVELKRVRIALPKVESDENAEKPEAEEHKADESKAEENKPQPEVFLFDAPTGERSARFLPYGRVRRVVPVPGSPIRLELRTSPEGDSAKPGQPDTKKTADLPPSIDA